MTGAALAIWAASAIFSLSGYLHHPASQNLVGQTLWIGLFLSAVVAVVGTVALAIFLTVQELQSERPYLLRLSNMTEESLVEGYVFRTLYIVRIPLLLVAGLVPVMVVGWAHSLTAAEVIHRCAFSTLACKVATPSTSLEVVVSLILLSAIVSGVVISIAMTGAAIGVWMTLFWRDLSLAICTSVGLLMAVVAPLVFFFILYISAALHIILRPSHLLAMLVSILTTIAMGLTPYLVIGESSLRAATRKVWQEQTKPAQ